MIQKVHNKDVEQKAFFAFLFIVIATTVWAGTGGAEVDGLWDEIKAGILGGWGKLIAVFMIFGGVFLLSDGKKGWGLITMIIGFSLGLIPAAIDARYTLVF
jgi:hypothetical protein